MNSIGKSSRRAAWSVALAAAVLLAGCGGGIYLGFGGGFGNDAPQVSIAGPSGAVAAGSTVTVAAAAVDDHGIDMVEFYRLDSGGARRIASLLNPPYELAVTVPTDGRTTLQLFARAYDFDGNRADSAVLSLTIVP